MSTARRPSTVTAMTLGAVLSAMLAMPASAANTVTQTINAGTRSSSIADLTLGAVTYSHSAQSSTGTMVLTADDSSGSGAGWNVTVLGSNFVYAGANGGTDIPAANFSVTSAAAATSTAGEPIHPIGGPKVPLTFVAPGTLDVARKTLHAELTFGEGTYTQNLGVSLGIPAQSRVGTYTGTMTVTISAGP
ncbi:MAG: WxL domain-containing protein [Chloroflexota bacterium]|nr:WxL domain-containing protein [Chloroflexota bacterium]